MAEHGAQLMDLDEAIKTCEIAIILVDHDEFKMVPARRPPPPRRHRHARYLAGHAHAAPRSTKCCLTRARITASGAGADQAMHHGSQVASASAQAWIGCLWNIRAWARASLDSPWSRAQLMSVRGRRAQVAAGHPPRLLARASARVRLSDVPIPVALLLLTMMVPRELEFQLGVALTLQRLVLLFFLPLAFLRLFTSRTVTLRSFDLLLIGAFAYFWLALFPKETLDKALQSGSSQFIEGVGGYLIARGYVRTSTQFRATVKLLLLLVLVAGAAAAVESIFHKHWLKPTMTNDMRMGLVRAAVTFDHPIHYGVFCLGVFALIWFVERDVTARIARAALASIALFFSLSSAPITVTCLVLAGAFWERITRSIPHRVWVTNGALAVVYLSISLFAN